MAENPIRYSEFADPSLQAGIDTLKQSLLEIDKIVERLRKSTIKIDVKDTSGKGVSSIGKAADERKNAAKTLIELEKEKILRKQAADAAKLQAKEELGLISAYDRESQKLNALRKQYKDIAITFGENSKQARVLQKEVVQLDNKLKGVDARAGQFNRNVGNYFNAAKRGVVSFGAALGITGGVMALGRAFRGAFEIFTKFEESGSNLAAVMGKTKKEISGLLESAKALGATTKYTATNVVELQTEYAKLGFAMSEIMMSQKGTADLAAATNITLAESATIAGSALRAFGLPASEMQRVVEVLGVSTTKSALDIHKLSVAIPVVGTTAKNAGLSIEQLTGQLGTLVNRGIKAETAGTGLRNIFLTLSEKGLTYENALNQINTATDKNAAAAKLFGKEGATVAVVLAENQAETAKLTEELTGLNGELDKMAKEQLDNVKGQLTIVTSKYEGFILAVESGNGPISKAFKMILKFIGDILDGLTNLALSRDEYFQNFWQANVSPKVVEQASKNVEDLTAKYEKEGLKAVDARKKAIEEMIALEQIKNDEHKKALNVYFKDEEITAEKLSKLAGEFTPKTLAEQQAKKQSSSFFLSRYADFGQFDEVVPGMIEKNAAAVEKLTLQTIASNERMKTYNMLLDEIGDKTTIVTDKTEDEEAAVKKANEAREKAIELFRKQIDAMTSMIEKMDMIEERRAKELAFYKELGAAVEKSIDKLSDEEITAMIKLVPEIDMGEVVPEDISFFEQLRFDLEKAFGDDALNQIKEGTEQIAQAVFDMYEKMNQARIDQAEFDIDRTESELERLQSDLNSRREILAGGTSQEIELLENKIKDEEALLQRQIEAREKAVRQQQILDIIMQSSKLILSVAEIFASESNKGIVGVATAIAGAASLIASFAALKQQAKNEVGLGEGGVIETDGARVKRITGRKHNSDGTGGEPLLRHVNVEAGENIGVLTRDASSRFGGQFEQAVSMWNSGKDYFSSIHSPMNFDISVQNGMVEALLRENNTLVSELTRTQKDYNNAMRNTFLPQSDGTYRNMRGDIRSNTVRRVS